MLSPGEITKGMFITVLSWKEKEITNFSIFGDNTTTKVTDRSYLCDVLLVVAVNLPFIAVNVTKYSDNVNLGTRECSLMELNEDYVKAFNKTSPA